MTWRVAKSLDVLLDQINTLAPNRSKVSDGSIGDPSHAARSSDHNPWVKDGSMGVVTARDYTHDPAGGFDAYAFAETLRKNQDPRIKYVISNRRIFSGPNEDHAAWEWRHYGGTNAHDHHTHVSVKSDKAHYDSTIPWKLDGAAVTPDPGQATPQLPPLLMQGSGGDKVVELQTLLNNQGASLRLDGDFGPKTLAAVKAFQKAHGLSQDGLVGPYTWAALKAPLAPASQP